MSEGNDRLWGPATIQPVGKPLLVGRSSEAEVVLAHPAVSRRHAELCPGRAGLIVRDLGSMHGTRINGQRIREQVLQEGDRLEFGPVAYRASGCQLRLVDLSQGLHLEAQRLAIDRGGTRLLDHVDLILEPGQFVGLLGPSGAGKSTLMKCLAGYLPPATGRLWFDEQQELPVYLESYRSQAGYVPQEDVLYASLTARENLDFALRLRVGRLESEKRTSEIATVLERLRLESQADQRVATLSGGQRKRLNVGMELLTRPRILFLDEPTSGLDPAAESRLMRLLKSLAIQGVTVVCATHVLANLDVFDQVIVVAHRTVVFGGPPRLLLKHFAVAGFAELYEKLELQVEPAVRTATEPQPVPSPAAGILKDIPLVPVGPPPAAVSQPRIALTAQVGLHFVRGLRLILRDPILLAILVGQPLIIGLLINLSQLRPDGLKALFLFAVVTSIWLGLTNTAREVVRDRRIYVRERLLGVTPEGYLGAKVLLFGGVGLVQIMLLVQILRLASGMPESDLRDLRAWPLLYLVAVLWATYLSAMLLGLAVSTMAGTEEVAVATLPLIVLPQLLLTAVATGLEGGSAQTGSFRSLVILAHKAGQEPRGFWGWFQELASLPLYSRPALALLQEAPFDRNLPPRWLVVLVDWFHLLLLLTVSAAVLIAVFRRREGRWLQQA